MNPKPKQTGNERTGIQTATRERESVKTSLKKLYQMVTINYVSSEFKDVIFWWEGGVLVVWWWEGLIKSGVWRHGPLTVLRG